MAPLAPYCGRPCIVTGTGCHSGKDNIEVTVDFEEENEGLSGKSLEAADKLASIFRSELTNDEDPVRWMLVLQRVSLVCSEGGVADGEQVKSRSSQH